MIQGLIQFIGSGAVTVFGFFVLLTLGKLFEYCLRLKCMIFIVWVSWSHSCSFDSFRSTTKYLWRNLKSLSYMCESERRKMFDLLQGHMCKWCINFDTWQMENWSEPCKSMEHCGSTNRSSVLRVSAGPWANRL